VDPAKREALLAAARRLFLDRGFDAVTMGEIAHEACVSKATLYANFSEQGALLEAVIRRESERIIGDEYVFERAELDLEAKLTHFGQRLLTFLVDPQRIKLERLIATAAERHPKLAVRFFEAGPKRAHAILLQLIGSGVRQRSIIVDDPTEAAGDLIGLWQSFLRTEATLRYRRIGPHEVRKRTVRAVRLFMRLYGSADAHHGNAAALQPSLVIVSGLQEPCLSQAGSQPKGPK
jgi:TetR/AcrR family transcriptional repressor of mexJK operon